MRTKAGQAAAITLWTAILYGLWQAMLEATSQQPQGEQRLTLLGMALLTLPLAVVLIRATIRLIRPTADH